MNKVHKHWIEVFNASDEDLVSLNYITNLPNVFMDSDTYKILYMLFKQDLVGSGVDHTYHDDIAFLEAFMTELFCFDKHSKEDFNLIAYCLCNSNILIDILNDKFKEKNLSLTPKQKEILEGSNFKYISNKVLNVITSRNLLLFKIGKLK